MHRIAPLLLLVLIFLPHAAMAQSVLRADSLYQAGDYGAAAAAYATIAAQYPDSGRAWYRLGSSLYQTRQYAAAIEALEKAVDSFQPVSYAHYLLAQAYADAGRTNDALEEVRRTAMAKGIPYAVLAATPAFDALEGVAAFDSLMSSLDPCGPPEYRQFDFWVGEWEVRGPTGQLAGTNSIRREYGGCVLVERWAGPTGIPAGTSQNFYHKGDGKWHQNWIDGQASGPLWLSGGLDDSGAMVMTDVEPETSPRNRITWSPNPDGTVRQHWEQSTDGGATWATVFDGLYVPREEPAGG